MGSFSESQDEAARSRRNSKEDSRDLQTPARRRRSRDSGRARDGARSREPDQNNIAKGSGDAAPSKDTPLSGRSTRIGSGTEKALSLDDPDDLLGIDTPIHSSSHDVASLPALALKGMPTIRTSALSDSEKLLSIVGSLLKSHRESAKEKAEAEAAEPSAGPNPESSANANVPVVQTSANASTPVKTCPVPASPVSSRFKKKGVQLKGGAEAAVALAMLSPEKTIEAANATDAIEGAPQMLDINLLVAESLAMATQKLGADLINVFMWDESTQSMKVRATV